MTGERYEYRVVATYTMRRDGMSGTHRIPLGVVSERHARDRARATRATRVGIERRPVGIWEVVQRPVRPAEERSRAVTDADPVRDYLDRTIATIRQHDRRAGNWWVGAGHALADEIERLEAQVAELREALRDGLVVFADTHWGSGVPAPSLAQASSRHSRAGRHRTLD